MAKTITLQDNPEIVSWTVDIFNQNVTVKFLLREVGGNIYFMGEEVFWVTIPPEEPDGAGGTVPNPANWSQLPSTYVQTLTDLTTDAITAIGAKYLT